MLPVTFLPKYPSILIVICDDEPCYQIHASIFGKSPDLPQSCHSVEELLNLIKTKEYPLAKAYAFRRLAAQSLHSSQLRRLLSEKKVSEGSIYKIIADCSPYLNDEAWVQSYVKNKSKRYGFKAILYQLRQKGIFLEEEGLFLEEGESQDQQILNLLKTKYKGRNLADYKEKQKVIAALMRRGFNFDSILDQIQAVTQE